MAEDLEVGRLTGSPEGVINEEVSIKKISNKKTISVMEDILKVASTLYFELIFIFLVLGVTQ
tara:strand:- start:44 stop:229 length:186 start_codon:yes stop_codon:yes gene_type:complete